MRTLHYIYLNRFYPLKTFSQNKAWVYKINFMEETPSNETLIYKKVEYLNDDDDTIIEHHLTATVKENQNEN